MSVYAALRNANRRPDSEAQRLTDAVAAVAAQPGDDEDNASAVAAALALVTQQIADEKLPPRASASAGHREAFNCTEAVQDRFDDESHGDPGAGSLRADPRFLLPDEYEDDVLSESAGHDNHNQPADEPLDDGVESTPVSTEPDTAVLTGTGDEIDDGDVRAAGVAGSESWEMPERDASAQPTIYPDAPSSWDDQEELDIPTSGLNDDEDAAEPDELGDRGEPDDPEAGLAPSTKATAPPRNMRAPEPEAGPSLRQRRAERSERAAAWARKDRSRTKKYIAITAALTVAVSGLSAAVHGQRGKPPIDFNNTIATKTAETADAVPEAPPLADPASQLLLPQLVSASCGNDSDAVAPFVPQPPGHATRAWVCVRISGRDGNVLNITFDRPVVITSITIVPGWNCVYPDGRDEWTRHRLVTAITWRMGGELYPQEITPTRTGVTKQFPAVITQQLSMTITASTRPPMGEGKSRGTSISAGSGEDDPNKVDETTAISSIEINGHPVDPVQ